MKKAGFLLFFAVALMLSGSASAQNAGDNNSYFVTYYSNANTSGAPDGTLRLVNDGEASTAQTEGVPNGSLYASIYVFDDTQEMLECCSCFVTANGLLSESVNVELTGNPVNGRHSNRGVIKIVSSSTNDPTNTTLKTGLRGWMTHIEATSNIPLSGPFYGVQSPLADSKLVPAEKVALEQLCDFVIVLGSGFGVCSCTAEGQDF